MKSLIQTTIPLLAFLAIPFMFYTSFMWGFNLSSAVNSSDTPPVEQVFEMDEEPYIDDIPFDTKKVVEQVNFEQSLQVEFALDEEETIDDIPFSTSKIANTTGNTLAETK